MNRDQLRAFGQLTYLHPGRVLEELRRIEMAMSGVDIPAPIRALRTNVLKLDREGRDAAIFC
jgi:hypothetical protein